MADRHNNQHRYLVQFADGDIRTRQYDEPLTIGQHILDDSNSYVITQIDRQPEGNSSGQAHATPVPH